MGPENWIPIGISTASLAFSIFAFRSSRPRVHVAMSSGMIVNEPGTSPMVVNGTTVTVTNNGASPVQIQAVQLDSDVGTVTGEPSPHTPSVPCALEGNGGRGTWIFARDEMRMAARRDGGQEQVEFRAVVLSGRTRYRSRMTEVVHPLEPELTPRRRVRGTKQIRKFVDSWITPRVQPDLMTRIASIDLKAGTYGLAVRNFGGGIARGVTLELMRERTEANGNQERARVHEPLDVKWIARNRSREVSVPLQEEPDLTWWVRYRGRAREGIGALTRQDALEVLDGIEGHKN